MPMQSIRKILLPTDFSSNAEPALELAIELAQRFGARLLLLHAYIAPLYLGPWCDSYLVPEEAVENLRREAERGLSQLQQRVEEAGVPVETIAMEGFAREVISEVARRQEVDLIVMGTHGRTGFHRLALGSVAERVVRVAPCPVLTVGAKKAAPAERSAKPLRVLSPPRLVP